MISCNKSNTSSTVNDQNKDSFVIYYPLTLIIVGTIFNLFTFCILCFPTFQNTSKRPIIHYMRTIVLFDTIKLYGWNFDHYLLYAHDFTLRTYSVPTCKIFTFINYFVSDVSAWLRIFICLDRYLSLSRLHKTWFGHSKHVLIIIACIIVIFFIINGHILIFVCFYDADGSVNKMAPSYNLYPLWDYVHLGLYNCIPFLLMGIFNSCVIYHLIRLHKKTTIHNSQIRHGPLSITLVITTFLFLAMTTPATVGFAFFENQAPLGLLSIFDYIMHTYHILSFPLYMITFTEFRQQVINLITCYAWHKPQSSLATTKS